MTRHLFTVAAAFLLLTTTGKAQSVTGELDAYWAEVSRTVAEGDFEGYSAVYHPDAVLVFAIQDRSVDLETALAGWKPGFDQTAAGDLTASVDFRFSKRLISPTTAYEEGIFHYMSESAEGTGGAMVHFTALSVKKDGRWLMLMENQVSMATLEEWEALADQ
jgi:ketosteroid isomerase-like protein